MANIKVHVLNFHGPFSHIEIVLENMSVEPHTYYDINRWSYFPPNAWDTWQGEFIETANSKYAFNIEANPDNIVKTWKEYFYSTEDHASILGENCAVAAQKFLTHFANIPQPSSSNVSWNHLAFGIIWPSFIPCPVTLPGRIMDNAKFHTQSPIFSCTSINDLPNDHKNPYLKEAVSSLKNHNKPFPPDSLDRLKTLTDFYDQLHNMNMQAVDLEKRGYKIEAECAMNLTNNLRDASL